MEFYYNRLFLVLIYSNFLLLSSCSETDCGNHISYENININNHLNIDSLLTAPTLQEINMVEAEWNKHSFIPESWEVIEEMNYVGGRKLSIATTTYQKMNHHGVIIVPTDFQPQKKYNTLLFFPGLDQNNPEVNLDRGSFFRTLTRTFADYFIIIPSFRGQSLFVGNQRYCNDGFFGDAYEGAAIDGLTLLNISYKLYPSMDAGNLFSYGISRGATACIIADLQHPYFKGVVAQSGPYNFLHLDPFKRYGRQYKYQFLSKVEGFKTIRKNIIKNSPALFIDKVQSSTLFIHGENDLIVPMLHVREIKERMNKNQPFFFDIREGGHGLNATQEAYDWIESLNKN